MAYPPPNPLALPEILGMVFSHLSAEADLASSLQVSQMWFDCAVIWLYREMRVGDFLRLTETGRKEVAYLNHFPISQFEAGRLSKYAPHINVLSCSCGEYKNKDTRHAWRNSGRSLATMPVDPLEQLTSLLRTWASIPPTSPSQRKKPPQLADFFPRLRGLRGAFDEADDLPTLLALDFVLPLDPVAGIAYPLQAAYTFHADRDLRGVELVLRAELLRAVLAEFDPAFFFMLRRSASLVDLELVMLRPHPPPDMEWADLWRQDHAETDDGADAPYPPLNSRLRRLIVRTMRPDQLFIKLVQADLLGAVSAIEALYFGLERELEDDEMWDELSDSLMGDGGGPMLDTAPPSDGSDAAAMGSDTDTDTDSDSDASMEDGAVFGSEDGSGSGSSDMSDAPSWTTEQEVQVTGTEAAVAAAEAFLSHPHEMLFYDAPGYVPAMPFAHCLRDGPALERLLRTVASACPRLRVMGWDARVSIAMPAGWDGMGEEGRYGWLDRAVRGALGLPEKGKGKARA